MPLGCSIVVFITQTITSETMSRDRIQPVLTPVLTVKGADKSTLWMTAAGIFIKALDNIDDLLRDAVAFKDSPNHCSIHSAKAFLKSTKQTKTGDCHSSDCSMIMRSLTDPCKISLPGILRVPLSVWRPQLS